MIDTKGDLGAGSLFFDNRPEGKSIAQEKKISKGVIQIPAPLEY